MLSQWRAWQHNAYWPLQCAFWGSASSFTMPFLLLIKDWQIEIIRIVIGLCYILTISFFFKSGTPFILNIQLHALFNSKLKSFLWYWAGLAKKLILYTFMFLMKLKRTILNDSLSEKMKKNKITLLYKLKKLYTNFPFFIFFFIISFKAFLV